MSTLSGETNGSPDLAIYDLVGSGHHRMYLDLMIRWWEEARPGNKMDVWLPVSFLDMHSDLKSRAPSSSVRFRLLPPEADPAADPAPPNLRRFSAHNRAALQAISRTAPGHIVSMFLDHAQLAIWQQGQSSIPVSGILFRSQLGYKETSLKARMLRFRKKIVLRACLPHLHRIFCLDPFEVDQINALAGTEKAVHLPDGLPPFPEVASRDELRRQEGLKANDHVAFMGGSLARRKGIPMLCKAVKKVTKDSLNDLVLVFVGAIPESERSYITSALNDMGTTTRVIFEEGFATDQRLAEWWTMCDSVLIPYVGQIGSSHVLLRAAQLGKPVVGFEFQLMGAWIKQHQLGLSCPPGDVDALARALSEVQQPNPPGFNRASAEDFGSKFTVQAMFDVFSSALSVTA